MSLDVTGKGIPFEQWGAVDQASMRRMALDSEVWPLRNRIMFAALGWSNLIGHAEFDPAGLCHAMQTANPRTGELSIPGRRQVANAIGEARDLGLIGEGSAVDCLIAPVWWQKSGGRGGRSCGFHRIRARHERRDAKPSERHERRDAASRAS